MIDINIPLATDKGLENIGRHLGTAILATSKIVKETVTIVVVGITIYSVCKTIQAFSPKSR
eukprot:m.10907 g.10907  ORF g.10907 m.10907 type:complete len:61 (+) comp9708_c0_seq2:28-210(+)